MSSIISAIIVNYNAGPLLRDCIDSLLACSLDVEVVVVDNASSDASLDGLQDLSQIRIIRNPINVGFAAACNIGVQSALAPFLLFLNPDCSLKSGSLEELLDAMRDDDLVGMAGGLLINSDGTEQAGGRRAIPTPWRSFVRAFGLSRFASRRPKLFFDFHLHKQPLPEYPVEVEAVSGACMLIKREAMDDVGLWDEGYFLHCEDLDLCMRFRQKGWEIIFVPDAPVIHHLGVCSRSRPLFVEWHKHKGMVRFYHKFFRHQYPGVLMWLVNIGVWFRFVLVSAFYTTKHIGRMLGIGHEQ